MDWELYFKNIILERGYDYYQMNAVEIINASNRSIDAKVIGSDAYDVRINFKNREIKSMYCSCPYYDNCKHQAAVLYYADNHPEIFPKNEDIDKLVKNVSLKDLHEFLIEELANDKDLLNRFKVFTDSATDEDFYEKKLTYCFSKPVNVIRFIDEDMSFLIKNGNFDTVLKLSGLIVDYLKEIYHCEHDAFIDILYKLDSIMICLFNRNYEKPVLDFLGNIILTNDNIEILDMLTDTYSRIGMLKSYLNIRDDNMSFFPIMAASIANMAEIEARAVELNNIGVDLANEGNFEEALEFFSQAHSLVPEDPSIAENIQICLDALNGD